MVPVTITKKKGSDAKKDNEKRKAAPYKKSVGDDDHDGRSQTSPTLHVSTVANGSRGQTEQHQPSRTQSYGRVACQDVHQRGFRWTKGKLYDAKRVETDRVADRL